MIGAVAGIGAQAAAKFCHDDNGCVLLQGAKVTPEGH
jgi:hypothetical protein